MMFIDFLVLVCSDKPHFTSIWEPHGSLQISGFFLVV